MTDWHLGCLSSPITIVLPAIICITSAFVGVVFFFWVCLTMELYYYLLKRWQRERQQKAAASQLINQCSVVSEMPQHSLSFFYSGCGHIFAAEMKSPGAALDGNNHRHNWYLNCRRRIPIRLQLDYIFIVCTPPPSESEWQSNYLNHNNILHVCIIVWYQYK